MESSEDKKVFIDHASLSKYASFSLDVEEDEKSETCLRIVGN